jgi:hypothetical protein
MSSQRSLVWSRAFAWGLARRGNLHSVNFKPKIMKGTQSLTLSPNKPIPWGFNFLIKHDVVTFILKYASENKYNLIN